MGQSLSLLAVMAREPLISWSSGWTYVLFGGLLLAIVMGTWTGAVAANRGRSMQWWFIIGFFLPVIGLIAVYTLKPLKIQPKK